MGGVGMPAPLQVKLDGKALRQLSQDAAKFSPALRVALRRGMAGAAKPLVQDVKTAASWSKRIPGATSAKVSFSAKGAGVKITVNPKKAPEAAPLNAGGKQSFRHPVWADARHKTRDQWTWVTQRARVFFAPVINKSASKAEAAFRQVMADVAKQIGF